MTHSTYRPVAFALNGRRVTVRVPPMKRLLDVLREECGLTGTKEGCGEGECGACTVILDGKAVNACLIPIGQAAGARVTTIEGLKGRHRLQAAFANLGGAQCGICTPGMILAAVALGPRPTLDQVRTGLAGNICRCTGYEGIYRAIKAAHKQEVRSQKTAVRRQKSARVPLAAPKPAGRTRKGEGGSPESRIPARSARRRP
jgi:aerobic-type carbon monoxide dehydrogenase small subunit (CoxS/CutS family)